MTFAEKLKELRRSKNITQQEMADSIGVTRRAYIAYEQGTYPRKREIYSKLADIFECDVNYLLTENESFIFDVQNKYGLRGKADAEKFLAQATSLFAGGALSDEDKDKVMQALQEAYWKAKQINKKYASKPLSTEGSEKE